MKTLIFLSLLTFPFCAATTLSQKASSTQSDQLEVILPKESIKTATNTLEYTPYRGFCDVQDGDQKENSRIHYIAYIAEPTNSARPLFFCFNGGPGSSSVWLHMGLLGPQIVQLKSGSRAPFPTADNALSPLEYADLIFIDPVSTGFSQGNSPASDKKFHGVEEDISTCTQCVRELLSRFNRWNSPLFLVGESYGGIRAIGLANALKDKCRIDLNGIIMISPAIDLEAAVSSSTLAQICAIPTYALISQHFEKCASKHQQKSPHKLYEEVKLFAQEQLLPLLIQGSKADLNKKRMLAQKLAEYTGIPKETLLAYNLKLPAWRFQLELLKDQQLQIGTFDGRQTMPSLIPGVYTPHDPSLDELTAPFTASLMQHLRSKLGWDGKGVYTILANGFSWDWKAEKLPPGFGYLSFTDSLRAILLRSPNLNLFIASGLFDLATPTYSQEYSLDQLFIPVTNRIKFEQFKGGHMMYTSPEIRDSLLSEIKKFVFDCDK